MRVADRERKVRASISPCRCGSNPTLRCDGAFLGDESMRGYSIYCRDCNKIATIRGTRMDGGFELVRDNLIRAWNDKYAAEVMTKETT